MTLREATRDLHHACERHPLGQRMVNGEVTPQEWADWLSAFNTIHATVDRILPLHMHRQYLFNADFEWLRLHHNTVPANSKVAADFAELLVSDTDKLGAAYVLHGAHRRGGRKLAETVTALGLPCAHTHYDRPKAAESLIKSWAEQTDLVSAAVETFDAMLRIMDEIIA